MDNAGLVEKYLAALTAKPTDTETLSSLLADDVLLQSTSGNASGREAVLARMTDAAARVFRESTWSTPEAAGEGIKVTGVAPLMGSGGTLFVFHFRDGKISLLQHQFFTARVPGSGSSIQLTQEIKDVVNRSLEEKHPIVVAYVDERDRPVLSFRGSIQAFSDTQLALWLRPESRMTEAIKRNPNVSLIYRNEDTHAGLQFQGRARISSDPEERRRVYESMPAIEQERDLTKLGVAVIIDLDYVEGSLVRLRRESERVRMERNEA